MSNVMTRGESEKPQAPDVDVPDEKTPPSPGEPDPWGNGGDGGSEKDLREGGGDPDPWGA
jgi:hypothetical protein